MTSIKDKLSSAESIAAITDAINTLIALDLTVDSLSTFCRELTSNPSSSIAIKILNDLTSTSTSKHIRDFKFDYDSCITNVKKSGISTWKQSCYDVVDTLSSNGLPKLAKSVSSTFCNRF